MKETVAITLLFFAALANCNAQFVAAQEPTPLQLVQQKYQLSQQFMMGTSQAITEYENSMGSDPAIVSQATSLLLDGVHHLADAGLAIGYAKQVTDPVLVEAYVAAANASIEQANDKFREVCELLSGG